MLDFVDQCIFKIFMNFPSQDLKIVYSFESLSLKPMQGNGVTYLTMLALHDNFKKIKAFKKNLTVYKENFEDFF